MKLLFFFLLFVFLIFAVNAEFVSCPVYITVVLPPAPPGGGGGGAIPMTYCGDGICQSAYETTLSCPEDCKIPVQPLAITPISGAAAAQAGNIVLLNLGLFLFILTLLAVGRRVTKRRYQMVQINKGKEIANKVKIIEIVGLTGLAAILLLGILFVFSSIPSILVEWEIAGMRDYLVLLGIAGFIGILAIIGIARFIMRHRDKLNRRLREEIKKSKGRLLAAIRAKKEEKQKDANF